MSYLCFNSKNFENLTFNTCDKETIVLDDKFDPGSIFSIRMALLILFTLHLKH